MKRGQISQIFGYIMGVIIIGMIFVLAYNGINSILNQSVDARIQNIENDLVYYIETLNEDFGTIINKRFTFPSKVNKIYFIDSDVLSGYCAPTFSTDPFSSNSVPLILKNTLVDECDSNSKTNLFLIGNEYYNTIKTGHIDINTTDSNDLFMEVDVDGTIELKFEGIKGKTKITLLER